MGGTWGMQNHDLTVHGSDGRDTTFQVDGMMLNGIKGDGSVQSYGGVYYRERTLVTSCGDLAALPPEVAPAVQEACLEGVRTGHVRRIHNTPQSSLTSMNADQGIYAQDSWTLGRFSINPGVRFEHFNSSIEATGVGGGRFVPARQFAARSNVPNWNDVSPRFGFAWDVKGDGKTAVKLGTGKYLRAYSTGFAALRTSHFALRTNPSLTSRV